MVIIHHHKLLCKSPKESLPGLYISTCIASASEQKYSRTGNKSEFSRVLQQNVSGSQTRKPVKTYTRPQYPEQIFKHRVIQNGDYRDNKDLSIGRRVGHLHRFPRCILPHSHSKPGEVHAFSCPGQTYQFKALPFSLSTAPMEFTVVAKEVKLLALQRGIRIHQ